MIANQDPCEERIILIKKFVELFGKKKKVNFPDIYLNINSNNHNHDKTNQFNFCIFFIYGI